MLWQSLPMPHKRPRKAAGERFGFWHLGRISNLNAPATFLEGRKIRVIKYLMNIPQIFSKINLIRDFRGLVHSWECSALPSSGGPAGKTVQSTAVRISMAR